MNERPKTVLIADNHPLFRAGVRATVEEMPEYRVIGGVADGAACVAQAAILAPDFITIDLNMPGLDGFEVAARLRDEDAGYKVVIVSMYADKAFVEKAMEAGAHGFVAKEDAATELGVAFEQAETHFFMSSSAGKPEPPLRAETDPPAAISKLIGNLTQAERRILRLVSQSMSSREIADVLGITERTVHTHRNNICSKTGAHGANALLTFALSHRDDIELLCTDPN
jgi:DNA-binding NarL/FixJ family response regulator